MCFASFLVLEKTDRLLPCICIQEHWLRILITMKCSRCWCSPGKISTAAPYAATKNHIGWWRLSQWDYFQLIADVRFFVTRSVYLSSPESCCTPAVIFRAAKIPEIVSRLSTEAVAPGHAKDHILDDSAFVGRQTDTNLVVHIGAVSSVRKRRIVLSEVMAARNRIHWINNLCHICAVIVRR